MSKTIVLGIGSRIMRDDGIGLYLAEDLSKRCILPGIRWILGETDIDYCLSELADVDFIIILDAVQNGKSPGEVMVFPLCALKGTRNILCSIHGLHLLDILPIALNDITGFLVGIEPCEMDYGLGLSDTLKNKYPEILEKVSRTISKLIEP